MSAGNVVTLTPKDIQRRRLEREGRSVFVEFFCAPGCDVAEASVSDWPQDLTFNEMAVWLRSFAHEIDKLAEETNEQDTRTEEP